jgi:hypothetical protein
VDWLIEDSNESPSRLPEADKPEQKATADEMSAWLAAFSTPKPKRKRR